MESYIETFTTKYDTKEDRLKLTCKMQNSFKVSIWLTNRFSKIMISKLFEILEKRFDPLLSELQNSLLQEFINNESSISATPVSDDTDFEFLCNEIDLNYNESNPTIIFKDRNNKYILIFDETNLRRWLTILYNCYQKANWDLTVFPKWFRQSSYKKLPEKHLLLN